jgi:hypothetical protein
MTMSKIPPCVRIVYLTKGGNPSTSSHVPIWRSCSRERNLSCGCWEKWRCPKFHRASGSCT